MAKRSSRNGRPLTLDDLEHLGELDGGIQEYETAVTLSKRKVTLILYPDSAASCVEKCLDYANRLIENFPDVEAKLGAYLTVKALPAWNKIAPDGQRVSEKDLAKDATLHSICIHANGERSFAFATRKLFGGHSIVLRATPRNRILDMDTPG